MKLTDRIYIAGHSGLVGSALKRRLELQGYKNLICKTRQELDLTNQQAVDDFFAKEKPDAVFLAAAKVGGILANQTYPADFIFQNLAIQNNIIQAAYQNSIARLLFLGSSCIYPRDCMQPIQESYLLTGKLESTNRPYALAKIAGIEMCASYNRQYGTRYLAVMPTNLYGPGDHYDLQNSHVIPALIRKIHEAKISQSDSVTVWGTGSPRREFLFVDDLADACVFLMELSDPSFDSLLKQGDAPIINVGCGSDLTIQELVQCIQEVIGFQGEIVWDRTKPDGTPRKLLDISRISALGWQSKHRLLDGLNQAYQAFLQGN